MIACIDVGYHDTHALAACVVITSWDDSSSLEERVELIDQIEDYQPGEFYRRELPCVQAVLAKLCSIPSIVVVDGYVWLDSEQTPGLGAHLYSALQQHLPVIGVAKSAFRGSPHAVQVRRGDSDRPLFVTAVGLSPEDAADRIRSMHGDFRMPTALKRVDQLSRGEQPADYGEAS